MKSMKTLNCQYKRSRERVQHAARFLIAAAAVGLVASLPAAASADVFTVSGPCSLATPTASSPISVSQSCTSGSTGETYQGTAASSQGHLGTAITTTGGPTIQGAGESSLAEFTTDVVFSPTGTSTLTTIPVALNLDIVGSLSGGFDTGLDWTIFGGDLTSGFSFAIDSAIAEGGNPANPVPPSHSETNITYTSGGETLLADSDVVSATATTALFTVPVGSPVPIAIALRVDGAATLGQTGDADFLHSADFPLTNIFTLPDGFTANDPDMFIVNNDFVAPGSAVPEPSSLLLLLSGVSGLLAFGRRGAQCLTGKPQRSAAPRKASIWW